MPPQSKYPGKPAKKYFTPAPANTVGSPQLRPGTSVIDAVRIGAPSSRFKRNEGYINRISSS